MGASAANITVHSFRLPLLALCVLVRDIARERQPRDFSSDSKDAVLRK